MFQLLTSSRPTNNFHHLRYFISVLISSQLIYSLVSCLSTPQSIVNLNFLTLSSCGHSMSRQHFIWTSFFLYFDCIDQCVSLCLGQIMQNYFEMLNIVSYHYRYHAQSILGGWSLVEELMGRKIQAFERFS